MRLFLLSLTLAGSVFAAEALNIYAGIDDLAYAIDNDPVAANAYIAGVIDAGRWAYPEAEAVWFCERGVKAERIAMVVRGYIATLPAAAKGLPAAKIILDAIARTRMRCSLDEAMQ